MKTTNFTKYLVMLFALLSIGLRGQLSGILTIPGTYTSIGAAIADLNSLGVSGSLTINIAAGYTETAPVGGYTLNAITGASSANQITFQKNGLGANPLISAYAGSALPNSAVQDGVWIFSGSDYITIDGIDITDGNLSNPGTMEFGYGLFKASTTDGCQNNTIKNCVITLNRINNDVGAGPAVDGSRGIDVVNALVGTHTTAVVVSSASGANSNNRFYSNTIRNCNIGIAMIGFADVSPFAYADMGNDVGGSSALTGNTIIGFGGGGTLTPAAAIRTLAQYSLNASYNTINNITGGVGHAATLRGVFISTALSAYSTINNNTITLVAAGTVAQQVSAIENSSGATPASNQIQITDNLITNCTYSTSTNCTFYGIYNTASAAYLNISNNRLLNNSSASAGGTYYSIYNTGAVGGSVFINNNTINGLSFTASSTSLIHRTIYNTGAAATATLQMNGNSIQGISFSGAGSGVVDFLYNSASAVNQSVNNNSLVNLSINTSGSMYLLYCNNNMGANALRTITGNSVITAFSKTLGGGTVYGYYSNSTSPGTSNEINSNNNFSNMNVTGATALNVWYSGDGTTSSPYGPSKVITNNMFQNINAGTSAVVVLTAGYCNSGAAGTVSNNILSTVNCSCAITGIQLTQGAHNAYRNSVSSFTSAGSSSAVLGIHVSSGITQAIYKNRVYDLSSTQSGGSVIGINITAATTNSVYNNLVGDLRTPGASAANPLIGISLTGGTTHHVYYNSVNLNATSSGANFGSSAISVNASPTTINLRNNIFNNTSTASGTGTTTAFRKSSSSLANYGASSNNNLFYAGVPSGSNLIFYDGTNSVQSIAAFGTLVSPRDVASVTESPNFVSTAGANANFLNINTSIPTVIESGAAPISGITDDYIGTARNLSLPDIGAWEGMYTVISCTSASGGTLVTSSATACAGQTLVAASSSVSSGFGTGYLWKVATTSGGPYSAVSGGTGSTTTSYTSAPLPSGVYYVVLETTCAAASLTAISNEGTLTVNAIPTASASVSNSNICAGADLNFSGSGSSSNYLWSGPNAYTTSLQSPTLTVASTSLSGIYSLITTSLGCSSAPSTVAVVVNATPQTITLSPLSANICTGGSQTIAVLGGVANPTLNFGTQANQNGASTSSTGYPAPYTAYYGGQRMQLLILASELASAGFIANTPINSVQFPVVSRGANWGASITENQNFQVNIGATTLTSISAFQTGLTNVVAPYNFTPAVGYNNTHTFASPFIWNGTSNIILETTFSNNFSGTAADLITQYNSPTAFQSAIVYRADSQTASTMSVATTISYAYSARPDFRLNGTTIGTVSWSPGASLSSTNTPTVNASPIVNTNYTVTATLGSCIKTGTIAVNIVPVPSLSIAATDATVCAGSDVTLTVSGADTYSWDAVTTTNTIVVNPLVNTQYTVSGQNQNCTPVTQSISLVANPLPTVSAIASSTAVCSGQSAVLTASGAATYSWISGPGTNTYQVNPSANSTYSVLGLSAEGCAGDATVSVDVNSLPAVSVTPSSATVCAQSPATFTASGANSYVWTSGSTSAIETISPAVSSVYTVTGTDANNCAATQTVNLVANALPTILVSPTSPSICTDGSVVISASGAVSYSWTNGPNTASLLANPAATTVYTVEGIDANNCKNSTFVTVVVDICTGISNAAFQRDAVKLFPNPSTGLFTVQFDFEGEKSVVIVNSVGQVILQSTGTQQEQSIDLNEFAKGVYFVKVSSGTLSGNYKVVIH